MRLSIPSYTDIASSIALLYSASLSCGTRTIVSNAVITLKYGSNNEKVITGIKRISKPGLRVYAKKEELPRVLGGLGIAIISTSKGVMSDKQARKEGLGGEVIAYVW